VANLRNGSFELAGATPGAAQIWTSSFVSSLEEWADFAQNPSETGVTSSQEGLEKGWTGSSDQALVRLFVGETIDIEAAIFNVGPGQTPVERFERAWGTAGMSFLDDLEQSQPAVFSTHDQERFEVGWGTVALELPGTALAATFDGENREDFEDGWKGNDTFVFTLSDIIVENFENVAAPTPFAADASADTMELQVAPDDPIIDDDRVQVTNEGGALPTPLDEGVTYFLVGIADDVFSLAPTLGAAAIDLTSAGTGINYLVPHPALWWSRIMTTV
jgi:hypothetical protein